MSRLLDTLRPFYRPPEVLGGEPIDRSALRAALLRLAADLRVLFWVRAAMIGTVFLIELVLAVIFFRSPIVLGGIAAGFGLTVAGALTAMQALSREMAEVNLLVLLAGEVDAASIEGIVTALIRKLSTTPTRRNLGHRAVRSGT
jgi:hypothetical protein